MNASPSDGGPGLKAFRIELLAGDSVVGAYVVHSESILDAIGRGNPRMFDRARAATVDQIRITPLPASDP